MSNHLRVCAVFWAFLWTIGSVDLCVISADEPTDKEAAKPTPSPSDRYMRIRRDEKHRAIAMETAIVRYQIKSGATKPAVEKTPKDLAVDLVGVVHIGDKAYYDRLNKAFESYDVVLYELVAAEGARVPQGGRRQGMMHPIAALQYALKSILGLDFQLDCIDYTKSNFVHADMSPQEFAKSMTKRDESFWKIYFRLVGASLAQRNQGAGGIGDLRSIFSGDRSTSLKLVFASQLESSEGTLSALEGAGGSTIITERNKKAIDVMQSEIAKGKRKIAIFYGAGHLRDFDRRLVDDFGMEQKETTWLAAWDLQPKKKLPRKHGDVVD